MLTLFLGLVVTVILCAISLFIEMHLNNSNTGGFTTMLGLAGLAISFILGLSFPVSGYNDWELIEETELVSLSNSTVSGSEGLIYVSRSVDNVYTYRYEIDSEFGTNTSKEYTTKTVSENVEEIEDPNCKVAVIRKYTRTAKKTIWTFGLGCDETKYVFYVPEGTILKNVTLE